IVADLNCGMTRLPYRMAVEYVPDHFPTFEEWLLMQKVPTPGYWSTHERIPAHIRFRPREDIRAMRGRIVVGTLWEDAGGKLWRIGKKLKVSPYSLYLGERIKAFPHEADSTEWVRQVAVRYGEDVGGQFLAHRTPLIGQNRLWRAVVRRLFIDA